MKKGTVLFTLEKTQVAQLHTLRDDAQLDLERTIIRAPVDGTPTQLSIRPGVRATSLPLRPVIVFIPKEKLSTTIRKKP